MFDNRYDVGDLVASILLTYGPSTLTDVGSSVLTATTVPCASYRQVRAWSRLRAGGTRSR